MTTQAAAASSACTAIAGAPWMLNHGHGCSITVWCDQIKPWLISKTVCRLWYKAGIDSICKLAQNNFFLTLLCVVSFADLATDPVRTEGCSLPSAAALGTSHTQSQSSIWDKVILTAQENRLSYRNLRKWVTLTLKLYPHLRKPTLRWWCVPVLFSCRWMLDRPESQQRSHIHSLEFIAISSIPYLYRIDALFISLDWQELQVEDLFWPAPESFQQFMLETSKFAILAA